MSTMTASQRAAQDPRKAAMLAELGSARIDDFPMEDGESGTKGNYSRGYSHPPNVSGSASNVARAKPINNKWAKAMERGDFNDDDAVQVQGIDSMDDGQLARKRRHAARDTASIFVEKNYRRDNNARTPPWATIRRGGRNMFGAVHTGNGPVDIQATLKGDTHRAPSSRRPVSVHGGSSSGPNAKPSTALTPASQSPAAQDPQDPNTQTQVHDGLPDGATLCLQLPARLAAYAFPKRAEKYCGNVCLVVGSQPSEDLLILVVDDQNIEKIIHPISDYVTYMSVSNKGLMLKFTKPDGYNFYAVEFDQAREMNSFLSALQDLRDRAIQPAQNSSVASAVEDTSASDATGQSSAKFKPPLPLSAAMASFTQGLEERKDTNARNKSELESKKQLPTIPAFSETVAAPQLKVEQPPTATWTPVEVPMAEAPDAATDTGSSSVVTAIWDPIKEPALVAESKPPRPSNAPASAWYPKAEAADAPKLPMTPEVPKAVEAAEAIKAPDADAQKVPQEVIREITDWVWDTAQYMQHSTPEEFGFETMRSIIRATCGAIMGRRSATFRQLSPKDKHRIVEGKVRPYVERMFLQQLAGNPQLATEIAGPDASTQADIPEVQDTTARASSKPYKQTGTVYEMDQLKAMRTAADKAVGSMLPRIPLKSKKNDVFVQPPVRQAQANLPRVPIGDQVKQAAAASSDWLYGQGKDGPSDSKGDAQGELVAEFFAPMKSVPPHTGLQNSIHNQRNTRNMDQAKSSYQKDLEDLHQRNKDGKGAESGPKMTEITKGTGRLSLE